MTNDSPVQGACRFSEELQTGLRVDVSAFISTPFASFGDPECRLCSPHSNGVPDRLRALDAR